MSPFGSYIGATAARQILELAPDEQWRALRAIEILAEYPATIGLPHWVGEDGRTNYLRQIQEWSVTFFIDHADRRVLVLEIKRY